MYRPETRTFRPTDQRPQPVVRIVGEKDTHFKVGDRLVPAPPRSPTAPSASLSSMKPRVIPRRRRHPHDRVGHRLTTYAWAERKPASPTSGRPARRTRWSLKVDDRRRRRMLPPGAIECRAVDVMFFGADADAIRRSRSAPAAAASSWAARKISRRLLDIGRVPTFTRFCSATGSGGREIRLPANGDL